MTVSCYPSEGSTKQKVREQEPKLKGIELLERKFRVEEHYADCGVTLTERGAWLLKLATSRRLTSFDEPDEEETLLHSYARVSNSERHDLGEIRARCESSSDLAMRGSKVDRAFNPIVSS